MKQTFHILIAVSLLCISCDENKFIPSDQTEYPHKNYTLNDNGTVKSTEYSIDDFEPAKDCKTCHEDHYNDWSNSMHAYAMRDPVFYSGWNEEQLKRQDTGERFCIQCHNPAAFVSGVNLAGFETAEELEASDYPEIIKEGIGCGICHSMTDLSQTIHTNNSIAASAVFKMNPGEGVFYGSIKNPQSNEYHESRYNPIFSRSEACLPCHDMTVRGVEAEITFSEWNRIPGLAMGNLLSCQECHMPLTTRPAAAGGPDRLVHSHKFIGVDLDLSIAAEDNPQYEDVLELLQNSVMLEFGTPMDTLTETVVPGDSFLIPLTITSLTAHSLPSGVSFAREAWLEIIVTDSTNNILFESGTTATNSSALDETDKNLLLFTSYLLDENGDTTRFVTDVHELKNNSLIAFGKRYYSYTINTSDQYFGEINIQVRMLFRSFKPTALAAHPDLLQNISIFEMEILTKTVLARL